MEEGGREGGIVLPSKMFMYTVTPYLSNEVA